jgi:hypothetical protein
MVDGQTAGLRLLGAHVAESADQVSGERQRRGRLELGQAEISDPMVAARVDEHVGRLDVAVDDAELVGVFEGVGGLLAEEGHGAEEGFLRNRAVGGETGDRDRVGGGASSPLSPGTPGERGRG